MIIKVTADHIKKGKRACKDSCPMVLAIQEQTRYPNIEIGYTALCDDLIEDPFVRITYADEDHVEQYTLPQEAGLWVLRYDGFGSHNKGFWGSPDWEGEPIQFEIPDNLVPSSNAQSK